MSFCLDRLTFFESWPSPESVISEDNDLATTCGLCLGEEPGEELSSVSGSRPRLLWLRSLFILLVTVPEPSVRSSACLSLSYSQCCFKCFQIEYLCIYLRISCLCEIIMFSLSCKTWFRRTCSLFRLPEIKLEMNLIVIELKDEREGGR